MKKSFGSEETALSKQLHAIFNIEKKLGKKSFIPLQCFKFILETNKKKNQKKTKHQHIATELKLS